MSLARAAWQAHARRSSHVLKMGPTLYVGAWAVRGTWRASASHARAAEVAAQPLPMARPSQGDDVHGFPYNDLASGGKPARGVVRVCWVHVAFAGTTLMTASHRRVIAGQRHKTRLGPLAV